MSSKKTRDNTTESDEGGHAVSANGQGMSDLLKSIEVGPWLDRASEMLQARPAVTIGAAMGAGFVLGLTLFSKLGRIALIGALGLGTEIVMQKLRGANNANA